MQRIDGSPSFNAVWISREGFILQTQFGCALCGAMRYGSAIAKASSLWSPRAVSVPVQNIQLQHFFNTSGEKLSGILGLPPGIQRKRKPFPTMSDLVHVYPGIDVRQHAVDDQWQRQLRWFTRQMPRSRESFAGITFTNSQRDVDSNIVHIFDSSLAPGPDR